MQDTIHIGWRGWVDLDTKVKPFLEDKKTNTPHYKIDPYFMSKEWQQKNKQETVDLSCFESAVFGPL